MFAIVLKVSFTVQQEKTTHISRGIWYMIPNTLYVHLTNPQLYTAHMAIYMHLYFTYLYIHTYLYVHIYASLKTFIHTAFGRQPTCNMTKHGETYFIYHTWPQNSIIYEFINSFFDTTVLYSPHYNYVHCVLRVCICPMECFLLVACAKFMPQNVNTSCAWCLFMYCCIIGWLLCQLSALVRVSRHKAFCMYHVSHCFFFVFVLV